jgi:MFS family permease
VRARMRGTFSSLNVRNYRLFFVGQLVSLIFGWVQITGQDWLVLQLSHNSATALGVVTALQFTPVLLFSLYAGKLADRFDKRTLLLAVNAAWLVLATVMGILVVSGAAVMGEVFLFAALWGVVSAVETPVRQSFIVELAGNELLPNALGLAAAAFNAARVIGPALGGLAIAGLGTGTAFLVNAVSYVAPLIALSLIQPGKLHRAQPGQRSARDARVIDGLRYVLRRADLMLPMGLILVIGMVGFNFQLTLAVMAKTVFHTNAASFGLLTTALAGGALLGALAGAQRRSRPSVWVVIGSAIGFGVFETLAAFGPNFLTAALLLMPTGFFMLYFGQAANQRVQLGVDPAVRGRVVALYFVLFVGTNPVGGPLLGWVAEHLGARASIWLGGIVTLLTAGSALAVRLHMAGGRIRLRMSPLPRFSVVRSD